MAGMPQSTGINIVADDVVTLPITLVGVEYTITPPKAALSMDMALKVRANDDDPKVMMDAIDNWLKAAFVQKDFAAIKKRLSDPKDRLDLTHINQLMEAVIEQQNNSRPSS